ncbi:hypothetical protein EZS27_011517 [termite gut metagenome]|uniref:Uncharacterized protein n=1 Tax=termite gut metagenome TaxID=433724 RepID=A0A5J4S4D7_9ZZZZ
MAPFTVNLSKEDSLYQHLEYTGCGSISLGESRIEQILSTTYKGLFCKGFTKEQFEKSGTLFQRFSTLIIPCLQDNSKFQLNAMNDEVLENQSKKLEIVQEELNMVKPFMNNYQMSSTEIKELIKSQGDYINNLLDIWDNSSFKNMTLTSVGIAIAIANLRRKTGITIDLGIWIK